MLLLHKFQDAQLNLTLELFLRMIKDFFKDRLISVVLYGSILFDDLAPGYGDLDFLTVIDDDLSDEERQKLIEFRKLLRSGDYGIMAKMIEGAFLPRQMLNPDITGKAFWWGTSGEIIWNNNQLGWFVLHVIRECGIIIYGENIRQEIPVASDESLKEELLTACNSIREHAQDGGIYLVDYLLSLARFLLWLKEGRLSSKSEAADWGYINAKGSWRELLHYAKKLRLEPVIANVNYLKQWLNELAEPIKEACDEVEQELLALGFKHNVSNERNEK